ncbi:MAG TPA: MoaD/ThiS family protein [Spirochaetota bacterium]|nr:MoaD/ThiS family protein [Spirochaetota bacterium]HOM39124.1 MoaD/ThiS family protein [Spirochaetota bacterium]HPQ50007.1 MoaD/ThiS family protein [Spirochaetota bacterium]
MTILYNKKEINIDNPKSVIDIINILKVIPNTVIVLKNGKIVELNERVNPEDKIEVIKVISGG